MNQTTPFFKICEVEKCPKFKSFHSKDIYKGRGETKNFYFRHCKIFQFCTNLFYKDMRLKNSRNVTENKLRTWPKLRKGEELSFWMLHRSWNFNFNFFSMCTQY